MNHYVRQLGDIDDPYELGELQRFAIGLVELLVNKRRLTTNSTKGGQGVLHNKTGMPFVFCYPSC